VITDLSPGNNDDARAVAIQPNVKIVVPGSDANNFNILRFLPGLVADAGGPYQVIENGSVQLDASGTPLQPGFTLQWDLDGDGIFGETGAAAANGDEVGVNPIFSAAGIKGNSQVTVSLLVTDTNTGETATGTAIINVINIPPTVQLISVKSDLVP